MPTLRQLLFLATGLIIGCYFFKSTNLLALDTGVLSDAWSIEKECSRDKRAFLEENRRLAYNRRDAHTHKLLLWLNENQRIVENFTGSVEEYCDDAEQLRRILKNHGWDPIKDSEHVRKLEEIINACERILDLCGICPAMVEPQQIQPRKQSDQTIIGLLSSIPRQFLDLGFFRAFRLCLFMASVGFLLISLTADLLFRPVYETMSTLRQIIYVEFEGFAYLMVTVFNHSAIALIVSIFFDTCGMSDVSASLSLLLRLLLTTMISVVGVYRLRNRFFNVEWVVEDVLLNMDHVLLVAKQSQRLVEIRLAVGASRNQLRPMEDAAVIVLERIKCVKSTYESRWFFRLVCGGFIPPKAEEIGNIYERIHYLCCPAAAA